LIIQASQNSHDVVKQGFGRYDGRGNGHFNSHKTKIVVWTVV
jgi:hypothetical protein